MPNTPITRADLDAALEPILAHLATLDPLHQQVTAIKKTVATQQQHYESTMLRMTQFFTNQDLRDAEAKLRSQRLGLLVKRAIGLIAGFGVATVGGIATVIVTRPGASIQWLIWLIAATLLAMLIVSVVYIRTGFDFS